MASNPFDLQRLLAELDRHLAVAEAAHQPLSDDAFEARGHEEGLDAHLDQPGRGHRGVVRMQSAEHEVSGQGRLDRDLSGLEVADLADHDHVGVGPDHRAQAGREAESRLRVDLHLLDALQLVLHGVLDRHDRLVRRVERAQPGVERGRLSRAGGAGHEDRAVGLAEKRLLEERAVVRPHAERVDRGHALAGVQDSHDHRLAAHHRQRGHAQVDPAPVDGEAHAPVLRRAALGDVEVGHDLDA